MLPLTQPADIFGGSFWNLDRESAFKRKDYATFMRLPHTTRQRLLPQSVTPLCLAADPCDGLCVSGKGEVENGNEPALRQRWWRRHEELTLFR